MKVSFRHSCLSYPCRCLSTWHFSTLERPRWIMESSKQFLVRIESIRKLNRTIGDLNRSQCLLLSIQWYRRRLRSIEVEPLSKIDSSGTENDLWIRFNQSDGSVRSSLKILLFSHKYFIFICLSWWRMKEPIETSWSISVSERGRKWTNSKQSDCGIISSVLFSWCSYSEDTLFNHKQKKK